MKKILFATTNKGKIKEVSSILKKLDITPVSISDITSTLSDVPETGTTFKQNAIIKAKAYGKISGLITLADDTGLEVDILGGKPGIFSARYASTDKQRISRLLKELKDVPQNKRTAKFISVIAIFDPKTKKTHTVTGLIKGRITTKPYGTQGFGYDPIFFSFYHQKTFAQTSFKEKNRLSHRSRALAKAAKLLKKLT